MRIQTYTNSVIQIHAWYDVPFVKGLYISRQGIDLCAVYGFFYLLA